MSQRRSKAKGLVEAAKNLQQTPSATEPGGRSFDRRLSAVDEVASGKRKPVAQMLVDPKTCRMWRRHNRIYDRLTPQSCSDLIDRIAADGQQVPAIVRRLERTDTHQFEVIAGARRHFAVSHLRANGRDDLQYLVEIRHLTDEEAFHLSDIENRSRKDISDYERGRDYASALVEFYNGNLSTMATKIGMNRTTLQSYIYLNKLPVWLLEAYSDLHELSVRHGRALLPKLKNETSAANVEKVAGELSRLQEASLATSSSLALTGPEVFKRLMDAANKPTQGRSSVLKKNADSSEILDGKGQPLVLAQKGRKYVTLRVPVEQVQNKKEVVDAIKKVL